MNTILFIYDNFDFRNQIQYAVNTIFQNYNVEISIVYSYNIEQISKNYDLVIYYGDNINFNGADVILLAGKLFSKENYLKKTSIPNIIEYFGTLPVVFKNSRYDYYINNRDKCLILNIDIIQMIFFFLTCYEEFVINDYDKNGRFNINNSILYKNKLIDRPIVNEAIDFFIEKLNGFNINIVKKRMWGEKDFAVMLSHDVDCINRYLPIYNEIRLIISILLVDKKAKEAFNRILGYIQTKVLKIKKDPFNTFKYITDLERQLKYNSSFYFMTDKSGFYDINENEVREIIDCIMQDGSEIGFHPGLGTAMDYEKFLIQYNQIKDVFHNKNGIGVRQHYLSFNSSKTWQIQEKCNVLYDTSISFPQVAGFKVGYCLPYQPYDIENNKALDIWEIPLIVMDGSLFDYMKLNYDEAVKYMLSLFNQVVKYNGVYVILWHNSALTPEYNIFSKDVMIWFYNYIKNSNCLVESGRNILNLYMKSIKGDLNGL